MKFKYLPLFLLFVSCNQAFCQQKEVEQKNYYASLRSSETNVRAGPGQQYPLKFTFKAKSVPVKVISEYDNWNEIEDFEGQTGWVSQNLLTKKRTIIVRTMRSHIDMHSKDSEKSRILFHLENNVVADLIKCEKDWCAIKINDKKGWIKKAEVFGCDEA